MGASATGPRATAQAVYEQVMRQVRPVLARRIGLSPRAYDTADQVAEAVNRGCEAALGEPGKLTDDEALRTEALERIFDAAEAQARSRITYLPGPRIDYDDPRRERWRAEGEQLQGDIALVSDRCFAVIHHGPGHQSKTRCELRGPHDHHAAKIMGEQVQWDGQDASTGFFNEPPEIGGED